MMGYYGNWGWMGWFGGLLMLLFWVAVVLLVVWAVRALFPSQQRDEGDPALELLRRRYAAGEVTEAEYMQARRTLTVDGATVPRAGHY